MLRVPITVGGGIGGITEKILLLDGTVGTVPTVQLAFAWLKADTVPVILGQTNSFMVFDVFFYRAQSHFEIQPAAPPTP